MSKFIRTKDRIENLVYNSEFEYYVTMHTETIISKDHIGMYKTADTIEELCDEFVIEYLDSEEVIQIRYPEFQWAKNEKDFGSIYGAIRVAGKGLIYVAKMNDKGELELI